MLPPVAYRYLLPVLQRATLQNPAQRFTNIAIFVNELVVQLSQGRGSLPGKNISEQTSDKMRTVQQHGGERGERYQLPTHPGREHYAVPANYGLLPSPRPSPEEDWEKHGGKLFTEHDYNGAVAAYQRALALDPSKAVVWLALGDTYFALENYPEALRHYEQAVSLNPSDSLAWFNRGTTLDALGRRREAAECYQRANQLDAER